MKEASLCLWAVPWHGWHLGFILILIDNGVPGLLLDPVDLVEQKLLLCILGLPGVGLDEAQFAHFLVLHESALHSALEVLDLVVPAALGDELVAHHALRVLLGLVIALVEVVEREGAAIWCLRHYNQLRQQAEADPAGLAVLYSNRNVMYAANNNRRNKEVGFPTPQTRIEERNTYLEDGELCLEHSSPIELVCLQCHNQPICAQCLQSPLHAAHEARSIEWMKSAIASQYNEWILKLEHKSDRLENLHVQYESNKAEVNAFSKLYQEQLAREFEEIVELMMEKLQALSSQLEGFVREYIFEMSNSMERMRAKMKDMEKIITHYDKDSIAAVSIAELAKHSFEVRDKICELLDENDILSYKEKSVKPDWRISQEALKEVRNSINAISLRFKEQRNQSQKKGKKDLQLNQFMHREKSENKLKSAANPFLGTLTPKNKSKEKKLKQKKSPELQLLKKLKKSSAKMISMPASPAKEAQSTFLITPDLSRKKLFKKK